MQVLSVKLYFFLNKKQLILLCLPIFLILNVKFVELASQKDITDVKSFKLHVDIDVKYILNHFPLLEIMIIESTGLTVKDLD